MMRPWIHQNIIETVRNIKSKKKLTGGKKVNESDGYCAALPYFLYGYNLKDVKKIISTVTVSKISLKYALAKFYLIDLALKGCNDPINEFIKIFIFRGKYVCSLPAREIIFIFTAKAQSAAGEGSLPGKLLALDK